MSNIKNIILSVHDILINDEELLRLLHYPPQDFRKGVPNPLDKSLENILDKDEDELWDIRDDHIPIAYKSDDLTERFICRIYVYAGRVRSVYRNKKIAKREIIIDVFSHHEYEKDLRLLSISDRVNKLLVESRVSGLGILNYRTGYNFNAPKGYEAFRHIYEVGDFK